MVEKKDVNECKEYNALKFKTMIMTGNNIDQKIDNETNKEELDDFLMKEMANNKKQPWAKLSKTDKIKKLKKYIVDVLKQKHDLTDIERSNLKRFMLNLLDRKKMTKNSEIDYDEENGIIKDIYIISFDQTTRKFSINKTPTSSSKKSVSTKKKTMKKKDNKEKVNKEKVNKEKIDTI
jgi:hypothetical protein